VISLGHKDFPEMSVLSKKVIQTVLWINLKLIFVSRTSSINTYMHIKITLKGQKFVLESFHLLVIILFSKRDPGVLFWPLIYLIILFENDYIGFMMKLNLIENRFL